MYFFKVSNEGRPLNTTIELFRHFNIRIYRQEEGHDE